MKFTVKSHSKCENKRDIDVAERNLLLKQIEQSPSSSYDDVNTIVINKAAEKDDSLEAKILKTINSAFHNIDINDTEKIMDRDAIKNFQKMLYSISFKNFFSENNNIEWNHAYSASLLMRKMIDENDLPVSGHLPLTVLLHDIGKIILKKYRPQKYKMTMSSAEEKHIPLYMEEASLMKITHDEVGGFMMKQLNMPEDIIIPIYYHHRHDIPQKYILETALLKFVDWIDYATREIPSQPPDKQIMAAAGIEEIDKGYWLSSHREIVCNIQSQYFFETNTTKLKKAIRRDEKSGISHESHKDDKFTQMAKLLFDDVEDKPES